MKTFVKFSFFCVLLCLVFSCSNDNVQINLSGNVIFEGTGAGVENARVYLARAHEYEESSFIAIGEPELTDASGKYTLTYWNDQRYDQLYLVARYQGINDNSEPKVLKMESEAQTQDLVIPALSSLKITLTQTGSTSYEKVYFEHPSRSDKTVFFDNQFESYSHESQFYGDTIKIVTLFYPSETAEAFSYYFEDASGSFTDPINFTAPSCDIDAQCTYEIEY